MTAGKSCSSLVSPESSVGGQSEHQYAWHSSAGAAPAVHDDLSAPAYNAATPDHFRSSHEPTVHRSQLPDLDSSQPGPIEIDTSLLYTPQSGTSSTDVSQTGEACSKHHLADALHQLFHLHHAFLCRMLHAMTSFTSSGRLLSLHPSSTSFADASLQIHNKHADVSQACRFITSIRFITSMQIYYKHAMPGQPYSSLAVLCC